MILYGASGHAKVIKDGIEANDQELQGIFDDAVQIDLFEGLDVIYGYSANFIPQAQIIISVGDNRTRKSLAERVQHSFGRMIHPAAIVSATSQVGIGSVVMQGVIIQAAASIGEHCIINTGATVDHDCTIGNFVHIAPGNTICGNVSIGEGSLLGAGSIVIPGKKIGKWCIIGAGAVVTSDIPDFSLVVGIPGKMIKKLK